MKKRAPKRSAHERRRLILEGAHAVFATSSYARVNTTKLAKAAGVSAPALYRYFPSKKDLYVSALRTAGQQLLKIWTRVAEEAPDPLEAMWTLGLGYYDHVQSHFPVVQMWFHALCEADEPDIRAAAANNFAAMVDFLTRNLRTGQAKGIVRRDIDARVAAWHFMTIGLTFDLMHALGRAEELNRRKVEDWGRLYLESIREKPQARDR